jgi:hypothetical protein
MALQTEQGSQAPEAAPSPTSPNDWAAKLVEASKIAPEKDEQSTAPHEEEAELTEQSENEEPTSQEDQDETEDETDEADADDESEETEPSEDEPEISAIEADGTYTIDGQEVDGQTLLNGIAASKNFSQEKHKLRTEMEVEREERLVEVDTARNNHVTGLEMVLGMNGQALQQFQNVNWMQLQQENPAEYQRLQAQQTQVLQHGQQLNGQLQQVMAGKLQAEKGKAEHKARQSAQILVDKFGSQEAWTKRYSEIKTVANDVGYSDGEFNEMYDHRFMDLADRALTAEAKLAELTGIADKKIKNPQKTKRRKNSARVNTTPAKRQQDAVSVAQKSGSPKDWASVWEGVHK